MMSQQARYVLLENSLEILRQAVDFIPAKQIQYAAFVEARIWVQNVNDSVD